LDVPDQSSPLPAAPSGGPRRGHQPGSVAVALILALAAVLAAVVGARASIVSNHASDVW